MPVFQADVQINYYEEYITNVYHVNVADIDAAMAAALDIIDIQRTLIVATVNFNAVRVSTPTPGDGVYLSLPINVPGTRPAGSPDMPPFNRFRVDMSVGPTRPLRKFLMVPQQDDCTGGGLTPTAQTYVTTNYITPLVALGVVCSPSGLIVSSAAVSQRVGMRQLKRASKRSIPTI